MPTEEVPVPEHLTESLAQVRHDLRNPLNNIIGLSELWIEQTDSDSATKELHDDLVRIRDAAWQLNDRLDALLGQAGIALPVIKR